jgi:hypothetical protein
VSIRAEDWKRIFFLGVMSAPAVAFMLFDFIFPNISTPSLGKNMFLVFILSIIVGMPSGYFNRRTDLAIMTVMVYVIIGYLIAVVAYSAPFTVYDFSIIFPGLYFLFFINMTMVMVIMIVVGGFIGAVFGQLVGESMADEETAQSFQRGRA